LPEIVGAVFDAPPPPPAGAETVMLNAARTMPTWPSVTPITMLLNVPAAVGVPLSWPVAVLKDAQGGVLVTKNVNASPSTSVALGVKEYGWPTVAALLGVPEITGAVFDWPVDAGDVTGVAMLLDEAPSSPHATSKAAAIGSNAKRVYRRGRVMLERVRTVIDCSYVR
jgi:hypothetical protein